MNEKIGFWLNTFYYILIYLISIKKRPYHLWKIENTVRLHFKMKSMIGLSSKVWNFFQNFVLKVYIVITSKVFADFRFESPISIDFQSEILALLPPKSAKFWKSWQTFGAKVFADSRGKSLQTLEVITIQTFDESSSSYLTLKY